MENRQVDATSRTSIQKYNNGEADNLVVAWSWKGRIIKTTGQLNVIERFFRRVGLFGYGENEVADVLKIKAQDTTKVSEKLEIIKAAEKLANKTRGRNASRATDIDTMAHSILTFGKHATQEKPNIDNLIIEFCSDHQDQDLDEDAQKQLKLLQKYAGADHILTLPWDEVNNEELIKKLNNLDIKFQKASLNNEQLKSLWSTSIDKNDNDTISKILQDESLFGQLVWASDFKGQEHVLKKIIENKDVLKKIIDDNTPPHGLLGQLIEQTLSPKNVVNFAAILDSSFIDRLSESQKDHIVVTILKNTELYEKFKHQIEDLAPFVHKNSNALTNLLAHDISNERIESILSLNCMKPLINKQDSITTMTPLHMCCERSNHEFAEIFMNNGAKLDILDKSGNTPFHLLPNNLEDDSPFVALFIEKDVNPFIANNNGERVIDKMPPSTQQIFLEIQAAKDPNSNNVLHLAAQHNLPKILELLLKDDKNQALVNKTNMGGKTPLEIAGGECRELLSEAAKMLAPPEEIQPQRTETVAVPGDNELHKAIREQNHEKIHQLLRDPHNVETLIQQKNSQGFFPLNIATQNQDVDTICLFLNDHQFTRRIRIPPELQKKCLDKRVSTTGHDRLELALHHNFIEDFITSLEQEKDITTTLTQQRLNGQTLLTMATTCSNLNIFPLVYNIIKAKNLDPAILFNAKDRDGDTPLHHAANGPPLNILCWLLFTAKVDFTTTDNSGRRALDLLSNERKMEFMKIAQQYYSTVNEQDIAQYFGLSWPLNL